MNIDTLLQQRLICVAVIDRTEDAAPLAEALMAGGLNCIEVTFRTAGAAASIREIRKKVPQIAVGAGTLLTGLNEVVARAAREHNLPLFPGVVTPSEIMRALEWGWQHLKFFPSETFGGVNALKALIGPFGHTGVKFVPTGGITVANLPNYLAMPQVAAVGGSWMAERKLVTERAWAKVTELTAAAIEITKAKS